MRQEIIIRMHGKADKGQGKAMKVAAGVSGVESVTLAGGDKSLLLVIGDGVDSNKLTKKLREKVGEADIVELRTLDSFEAALNSLPPGSGAARGSKEMPVRSSPSSYHHHSNNQQLWQYDSYAPAPSPYAAYHYHPSSSPLGGYGYGPGTSSYSRAVARSHPANYSPLVERHDYRPMDTTDRSSSSGNSKTTVAVARRDSDANCCVIT